MGRTEVMSRPDDPRGSWAGRERSDGAARTLMSLYSCWARTRVIDELGRFLRLTAVITASFGLYGVGPPAGEGSTMRGKCRDVQLGVRVVGTFPTVT